MILRAIECCKAKYLGVCKRAEAINILTVNYSTMQTI